MNRTEAFQRLGIEATKDERALKDAYRARLAVTNPEDNPEGFKLLRAAYEEACRYAKEKDDNSEEKVRDTTPSGLWLEKVERVYGDIHSRQDVEAWKELFDEDIFLSLEEEENCRDKFFRFLMEHYKMPTQVWKLLDKKLSIVNGGKELREKLPAHFIRYIISKCERGEDVEFSQFEGPEDGEYDLFLQYYDRCWQALQEKKMDEAAQYLQNADGLGIRHPVMEICRAQMLLEQGHKEEAVALVEGLCGKYPEDELICYNTAEILWMSEDFRERAIPLFLRLKKENDSHYMANIRLTEWYYQQKQYREAKKCAEKILAVGGDDAFMELLGKVNARIESELEEKYRETKGWEPALELCWCYLQDGKVSRGIKLAMEIEKKLPPEKETEYNGLLAKLYVEEAEYEDSITMSRYWEEELEKRIANAEKEESRDRDRLRQAHLIRMQCYHNLGYRDRENFALAIKEGENLQNGGMKDIGILLEMSQIYMEMEEYDQSLDIVNRLVDEYQIFAAYASSLEVYRRQLNAAGVVQAANQCIRYFPNFAKAYEYLSKVYLDLDYHEDLEKVLEDAEKNGVKSVILDAYRFQMTHKPMNVGILNHNLKNFRKDFQQHVEEGEEGFYERGLPILTEYLYHYPDDFMLVERAIFYRSAHHYEEAREDFEKALCINPSNPYAFNGLSFVYKFLGDYEKALFFIKKAILYMDEGMSLVIYTDMGNLYSLLGDYERALAAYRQFEVMAGKRKDRSLWFGDNLAECTMRMGRIEEAAAIYERYYPQNKWERYKKLAGLYVGAGDEDKARQLIRQWGNELHISSAENKLNAIRNTFSTAAKHRQEKVSSQTYYHSKGWLELIFGDKGTALKAFDKMAANGMTEHATEGQLCDAVFASILCGDDKRGKKYAKRLQDWLTKEKFSGKSKYYNREKGHLQIEFLAAYYTESNEKLQEILDRERKAEICHFCTNPICKEMEGGRILFLIREGKTQEAKERMNRNLEVQPWDEYMLAIRHMAFGENNGKK